MSLLVLQSGYYATSYAVCSFLLPVDLHNTKQSTSLRLVVCTYKSTKGTKEAYRLESGQEAPHTPTQRDITFADAVHSTDHCQTILFITRCISNPQWC